MELVPYINNFMPLSRSDLRNRRALGTSKFRWALRRTLGKGHSAGAAFMQGDKFLLGLKAVTGRASQIPPGNVEAAQKAGRKHGETAQKKKPGIRQDGIAQYEQEKPRQYQRQEVAIPLRLELQAAALELLDDGSGSNSGHGGTLGPGHTPRKPAASLFKLDRTRNSPV